MIKIQASVSKSWVHMKTGITFDQAYYFDPLERRQRDIQIAEFLEEEFPNHRIHNLESNLVELDQYHTSQLYVGGIQPNLILGMLAGADFIAYPDRDADISETPLSGLSTPKDLPAPASLMETKLIRRWLREIAQLKKTESVPVIPPLFWDVGGRATIHGFFTTALKLLGQQAALLIYDNPQMLSSCISWFRDVWLHMIQAFSQAADLQVQSIHIGECSGTMVSPEDYQKFIIPPMEYLSRNVGPLRLHHCGDCTYLLSKIARIQGLASLDTGSGTSITEIRSVLGQNFPIDLMPPIQLLMGKESIHKIELWVDELLEQNQGGPIRLNYHLEPEYDAEAHLHLHEYLYSRGLAVPGRW